MHPLGAGRSPTDELERKTAHDTVYFTPPVSMENNVSPNNIPSEDGQFKYENRLSIISGFILFINILGSIALLITGIVELNSYSSNGYGWIYISSSIAVLLSSFLLHSFFIVVKEISINIKKKK